MFSVWSHLRHCSWILSWNDISTLFLILYMEFICIENRTDITFNDSDIILGVILVCWSLDVHQNLSVWHATGQRFYHGQPSRFRHATDPCVLWCSARLQVSNFITAWWLNYYIYLCRGYVIAGICLAVCLFVCLSTQKLIHFLSICTQCFHMLK